MLLNAAATMPSPLRSATYSTLFGLLAATGMRIGEALTLDRSDIDWDQGVLLIRQSKFGKSRNVPVTASTLDALHRYTLLRNSFRPSAGKRQLLRLADRPPIDLRVRLRRFQVSAPEHWTRRRVDDHTAYPRLCRPPRYADLGAVLVAQRIPPDGVGITVPNSIIVFFPFPERRRRAWSGPRAG